MDKKEMNSTDLMAVLILALPLSEKAPAGMKLNREMLRFFHRVNDKVEDVCTKGNEELCAQIYAIMRDTNDKILALCNGETIQEAPAKTDSKPVFQVGQRVQFKTWEEMKKEFGQRKNGTIDCNYGFTDSMKYLCGKKATINYIDCDGIVILTDCEINNVKGWTISTDMLKPVKEV